MAFNKRYFPTFHTFAYSPFNKKKRWLRIIREISAMYLYDSCNTFE